MVPKIENLWYNLMSTGCPPFRYRFSTTLQSGTISQTWLLRKNGPTFLKKGHRFEPFFLQNSTPRGTLLENSTLLLGGTLFRINMIIKEKRVPLLKKRVLFVAIAPQGYCFGTLFFWVTVWGYLHIQFPQVKLSKFLVVQPYGCIKHMTKVLYISVYMCHPGGNVLLHTTI